MKILESTELSFAEQMLERCGDIASTYAKCLKSKRAAIIVNSRYDIIGQGYNAPPEGEELCEFCLRDSLADKITTTEPCRSIHAEERAIMDALT